MAPTFTPPPGGEWPGEGSVPPPGYPGEQDGYSTSDATRSVNRLALASLGLGVLGLGILGLGILGLGVLHLSTLRPSALRLSVLRLFSVSPRAGLVLGIIALAGLALGIVALAQVRRSAPEPPPQKGRGLAIGGIATSSIFLIVLTIGLAAPLLGWGPVVGPVSSPRSVRSAALGVGLCFQLPFREPWPREVTAVPCSTPHNGQVYGRVGSTGFPLFGSSRPGRTAGAEGVDRGARTELVDKASDFACDFDPTANSNLKAAGTLPAGWGLDMYVPDAHERRQGDRAVICAFSSDSTTLTRSLLSDGKDT